jgi:hypothetical protein
LGTVLLLTLLALWYGSNLDGSFVVDEAFYARTGYGLLTGSPYTNPTHAFAPTAKYFIGLGQLVLGRTAVGARAPILLFALGTVFLTDRLGRRLWTPEAGLVSALVLGVSYPFVTQSLMAMLDVPLAFFTVALTLATLVWLSERGRRRLALVGVLCAAVATTKAYGFLYALPHVAVVCTVCVRAAGVREAVRRLAPAVGGGFATLAVLYVPFVLVPHPPVPAAYVSGVPLVRQVLALPVVGNFAYVFGAAFVTNVAHTGAGHSITVGSTVYQYPPAWAYLYWLFQRGGPLLVGALLLTAAYALSGFRRRDATALSAGAAVFVPLAGLSLLTVKFPRYVLPLYPLVLAGGLGYGERLLFSTRRHLETRGRDVSPVTYRAALVTLLLFLSVVTPAPVVDSAVRPVATDSRHDEVADHLEAMAASHPDETLTVLTMSGSIRVALEYYLDDGANVELTRVEVRDGVSDERYSELRTQVASGDVDVVVGRDAHPRIRDSFQRHVRQHSEVTASFTQSPDRERVLVYEVTNAGARGPPS